MKHVYVSPHLDDAVLSCGGAIHRQARAGEAVLVVTLFAGELEDRPPSAFALVQHDYWGNPPRPMALRRAEDAAALALLGARPAHLDYLDAVYRSDGAGGWLYAGESLIFGDVQPSDPLLEDDLEALQAAIAGFLSPEEESIVYAPLGAGHHVDHVIVRAAAEGLAAAGQQVAFYEDYPYGEQPDALEAALTGGDAGAPSNFGVRPELVGLDAADVAAKVAALAYYRSQMAVLFGGAERMPSRIWRFAATRSTDLARSADVGLAERLWWPGDGMASLARGHAHSA